ncbi:hypothetical protein BGX38DRAFT_1279704 [Terfezia claveryi]|nr:hypothetical protein BGX38DRAFT_1279704 [Terfezia claveryi]
MFSIIGVEELAPTVVEVDKEKVEIVKEKVEEVLAENSLSLKKTGTDKEVSNYTQDIDEILIRSEQQAHDLAIKAEAKHKLKKLEDDGKKIKDEAMRGQAKLDSVGKEKAKEKW